MTRRSSAACLLAAGLWAAACDDSGPKVPGDERIGTFAFTTQLSELGPGPYFSDCPLVDVPRADFSFEGTFSRQRDTGDAWFTLGGASHQGTFDGQVATASLEQPRQFQECGSARVFETVTVALLSASQDQASGGCPPNALDGGVPVDIDGGVVPPRNTPSGFDAMRACGELVDRITPDQGCDGGQPSPGQPCVVRYPISGVRR